MTEDGRQVESPDMKVLHEQFFTLESKIAGILGETFNRIAITKGFNLAAQLHEMESRIEDTLEQALTEIFGSRGITR